MKILARILALFLIMPVVELALLVQVDKQIGFWPTIGIILFTGLLGGYMAKREGVAVWNRFNDRLSHGGMPGEEVLDGVIILCAGALLITPGVLTDLFGFIGLFPPTRSLIRKMVMKRIKKALQKGVMQTSFGSFGNDLMDLSEMEPPRAQPWQGDAADTPSHATHNAGEPSDGHREPL